MTQTFQTIDIQIYRIITQMNNLHRKIYVMNDPKNIERTIILEIKDLTSPENKM